MFNNQNQGASIEADVLRALTDARDLAMKNTLAARIPECGDFGAIAQNLDWALDELARRTPAAAAGAGELPQWGAVHTVGDMVRNLLTLDQAEPIFTAFHVTIDGERRCRTRGITISRERVIDGKWIDSSRKDVPYANVVWAKQDERQAAPASAQPADPLDLSKITSVVKRERTEHEVLIRFGGSKTAADKFLEQFGRIVLAERAGAQPDQRESAAVPDGWAIRSWYSPAEGAYYVSERTIPAKFKESAIPLYSAASPAAQPVAKDEPKGDAA